jgi:chorismate--pyruvate lyase
MIPNQDRSFDNPRETTWLTQQGVQEAQIDLLMQSWLLEKGLLTERLRSLCGTHFRLEVLHEPSTGWDSLVPTDSTTATNGFKREVVMWCDDKPCIYATTSVSESTASMHPWLQTLGTEPLGERLQSLADVTRSDFEFTCVQASGTDAHTLGRSSVTGELWARRSKFTIKSHELTVIEVFLPGLVTCEGHRSGHE